jgi:hypothetical protein
MPQRTRLGGMSKRNVALGADFIYEIDDFLRDKGVLRSTPTSAEIGYKVDFQ